MSARLTWIGHSTVLIEVGGARLLTDPVLRDRLLHIKRVAPPVDPAHHAGVDVVLLSHLHHDHLDMPSLDRLDRSATLVVPAGAAPVVAKRGFARTIELREGERAEPAPGVEVSAVRAIHDAGRLPLGAKADPLGYLIEADGARIYFAGDTDLFEGMSELGRVDLALMPVWGWGPKLGSGHLDPEGAAAAVALLEPSVAVPIHWGTLFPIGRRDSAARLSAPPHEFAAAAARLAPAVEIRILAPGESTELGERS